jgi:hydrogenase maturation protease
VRARLPEAVELAVRELAEWGHPGTPRAPGSPFEPLNARSLALDAYEAGRPTAEAACRVGDPRVLEAAARRGSGKP